MALPFAELGEVCLSRQWNNLISFPRFAVEGETTKLFMCMHASSFVFHTYIVCMFVMLMLLSILSTWLLTLMRGLPVYIYAGLGVSQGNLSP